MVRSLKQKDRRWHKIVRLKSFMHQTINHKVKLDRLDDSLGKTFQALWDIELIELETKLLLNKINADIQS